MGRIFMGGLAGMIDYPSIALNPIPGCPGYLACKLGIIFSRKWGKLPRPMRHKIDTGGYCVVSICVNGNVVCRKVYHLILETYVGPCPPGMECCHGPGGKLDNSINNIRWGTKKENDAEKSAAGLLKGEKNGNAKLTEKDIRSIREMNPTLASRQYKISERQAINIIQRRAWSHVV
jgi:hypothetical protein